MTPGVPQSFLFHILICCDPGCFIFSPECSVLLVLPMSKNSNLLWMQNIGVVLSLPSCLTTHYLIWTAKYVQILPSYNHLLSALLLYFGFHWYSLSSSLLWYWWTDFCFLVTSLSFYDSPNKTTSKSCTTWLPCQNSLEVYRGLTTWLLTAPLWLAK